jgi:hypothetical protein
MSTMYECKASGCRADADGGPAFFCRTSGMNEHFRVRNDGTNALVPSECSIGCRCSDDGAFFHDAECARTKGPTCARKVRRGRRVAGQHDHNAE